jgi:hypothetical protein
MMHRTGYLRLQALLLSLTLIVGGLGLPLIDAAWFHSGPGNGAACTAPALAPTHGSGVPHALGCALLGSAAIERGMPAVGTPLVAVVPRAAEPVVLLPSPELTPPRLVPSLPRAPPAR